MPPETPRKVSLILHKFSRGGSDRVAAYLARGFADAGLQVELIVFCRGGEVERALLPLLGNGIPVHYLGIAGTSRTLDLLRGLPGLVRQLRASRPDVVISTANNMSLVSAIGLQLAGVPAKLVLKTTNPIATSRHKGLVRWLRLASYRLIFRWTAAVWTLSAEESAEMRSEFPRYTPLFRDVPNPYVTEAMLKPRDAPAGVRRNKTVISVARLTAQKRLDLLIAAFAHVRDSTARLLILGEGEDRAALTAQIAELGLTRRVKMPGYVIDVGAALASADVFVLPSDYEGLPAVVLEAFASDCPVLATDCFPAARSLVGRAPGCSIIERTNPVSLAALIDDRLGQPKPAGLRAVAKRYSIGNGVAGHLDALAAL